MSHSLRELDFLTQLRTPFTPREHPQDLHDGDDEVRDDEGLGYPWDLRLHTRVNRRTVHDNTYSRKRHYMKKKFTKLVAYLVGKLQLSSFEWCKNQNFSSTRSLVMS